MAEPDDATVSALERHFGVFGPVARVLRDDRTPTIDVRVIEPSDPWPQYTLFTTGMSARPMTVPDNAAAQPHAELTIALPPHWFADADVEPWPVELLRRLARTPFENDGWLAPGHTVPNGDPAEPYADDTALCIALIVEPVRGPEGFALCEVPDRPPIAIHAVLPIYELEASFQARNGIDALLDKFDRTGIDELLDVERPNVAKRRHRLL